MDHPIALSYGLSRERAGVPAARTAVPAGIESPAAVRGSRPEVRLPVEIGNDGWRFPIGDPTFEFTQAAQAVPPLREGGAALARRWEDHVAHAIRFASLLEQLPDRTNTITPAFDKVDAHRYPPASDHVLDRPLREWRNRRRRGAARATVRRDAGQRTDPRHLHVRRGPHHRHDDHGQRPGQLGCGRVRTQPRRPATCAPSSGSSLFPTCGTTNPTLTSCAWSGCGSGGGSEGVAAAGFDDITPAHISMFRYPTLDWRRPTEIAGQLQISKQSVHELLTHLERQGYLDREPDPTDGRARIVRLTDRGRSSRRPSTRSPVRPNSTSRSCSANADSPNSDSHSRNWPASCPSDHRKPASEFIPATRRELYDIVTNMYVPGFQRSTTTAHATSSRPHAADGW